MFSYYRVWGRFAYVLFRAIPWSTPWSVFFQRFAFEAFLEAKNSGRKKKNQNPEKYYREFFFQFRKKKTNGEKLC